MQTEVIFAGFGGQGVLFAGQILAFAGMDAGKEVTWMPSYGPEMRGGTANCTVIVADEEIGSPLIRNPKAAVVMNLPSLDKYENTVVSDGILIVNASLVDRQVRRQDLDYLMVPAVEIAETIGNKRLMNMVLLGALLQKMPLLTIKAIENTLEAHLPERHRRMLASNKTALEQGAAFARSQIEATGISIR